jgi:hypothetical protein
MRQHQPQQPIDEDPQAGAGTLGVRFCGWSPLARPVVHRPLRLCERDPESNGLPQRAVRPHDFLKYRFCSALPSRSKAPIDMAF